jgi:hypothetical protein
MPLFTLLVPHDPQCPGNVRRVRQMPRRDDPSDVLDRLWGRGPQIFNHTGIAMGWRRTVPGRAAANDEASFWRHVKRSFQLDPDIIHLSCGSIGACPQVVTHALDRFTRQIETDPFRNHWGDGLCQQVNDVRISAAKLLNVSNDEIAITRNTTEGMNLIARGLDLNPGDEILTTNHEHAGGIACWYYLAKRDGVKVNFVELPQRYDEAQLLELIEQKMTPRTRVFSFCHVDSITGNVLPIATISKIAKQKGIFFVCDAENGKAYAITKDFELACYDPESDQVTTKPIMINGKKWERANDHSIPTWVLTPDKKRAYLLLLNDASLLEIDLVGDQPTINHGTMVEGNNPDSRCGLDLGADGNVYAVIRVDNETGFGTGFLHHLVRFLPTTEKMEDLGVLKVQNPDFFDWDKKGEDLWKEKIQRVIHLSGGQPDPRWQPDQHLLQTIDLGFAFGDACVSIDRYPIRLFAPSEIAQVLAYEAIQVEMADWQDN